MAEASAPVPEVTPQEAYDAIEQDPSARIVDVRTLPEWTFTGLPALSGDEVVTIEWQAWPAMMVAADFGDQLRTAVPHTSTPLYFLCRSGARSLAAAQQAAALGYERVHNITGGFEGPPNREGHRGTVQGWKAAGLPWRQS